VVVVSITLAAVATEVSKEDLLFSFDHSFFSTLLNKSVHGRDMEDIHA